MSCDIHTKILIYSKVEKKYVDSHEFQDMGNWDFPEIFDGRNYEIFGILAGVRSDRYHLETDEFDTCPVSKTFRKIVMEDRDYHSFTWYYVDKLCRDLEKLRDHIMDNEKKYIKLKKKYPKNYHEHWYDDVKEDDEDYDRYDDIWCEDDKYLVDNLNGMIDKCYTILHKKNPKDKNTYDYEQSFRDHYSKYIDFDKTIVLFYFDS